MPLSEEVEVALGRLAPHGRLLVAVSGGADSVAALRLILELGREVTAAHFDHRLRESSAADAGFVHELCAALGVALVDGGADVASVATTRRWNLEDAARRLRYDFLHRAARSAGCEAIVVAHTEDDQAETFLLQALRGSAFPSGMPAKRGMVVRPLLGVGRGELREYLRRLGQSWREDESNRDVERSRAWLRHELLPVMTSRYPTAPSRLAASAAVLKDADTAIDGLAAQLLGSGWSLPVAALTGVPVAVQRAALARLVEEAGVEASLQLIEKTREAVTRAAADPTSGPWRTSLSGERFLRVAYGRVEVARRRGPALHEPVAVRSPTELTRVLAERAAHDVVLPPDTEVEAWLAAHPAGLVLRHRLPGDRVRLPGGSKSLADLLIDRKVPVEERDALLLLAAGDEVLWIESVSIATPPSADADRRSASPLRKDGPSGLVTGSLGGGTSAGDLRHMRLALEQAAAAGEAGELPVGAVVARGEEVVAARSNRTEADQDPSAHAELLAIRQAAAATGDWRLEGATLYVTLEPCPMCFGAVLQTRIERVVFGASNAREGALGSVMDLRYGTWKRRPLVEGGVLAEQSRELLKDFFARRR